MKYCKNCKYFGFFSKRPDCYYTEPIKQEIALKFVGIKTFKGYKYFSLVENAEGNCLYYKRKWYLFWINEGKEK